MSVAVVLLIALSLAGCSFLSSKKPNTFSLDRISPAAPAVSVTGTPFGIDGLELPPGVDRREIVVRQEDQKVEVRSRDLWNASLEPLMLHTLASDLADRLPVGMVILPGQAKPLAMRSIDVVVEELSVGPGPQIVIDARWTLGAGSSTAVAHRERIEEPLANLGSATVAAGMSRATATLADRIATQLR